MAGQTPNDNAPNSSGSHNDAPKTNAPSTSAQHTGISRRDILRTLTVGAVGGSVLQVIPADAAEYVHELVRGEKNAATVSDNGAGAVAGKYVPKYFSTHQYAMITFLCDAIIPKDEKSGGAVEAGAPEFIDLLTSENERYQLALGGGLMWLDGLCANRYNTTFLECMPQQKIEVMDLIAYRKNAKLDTSLSQGVAFFSFIRNLTCDAFYTSKIGIADLQYIGNVTRSEFPGCPPLPTDS